MSWQVDTPENRHHVPQMKSFSSHDFFFGAFASLVSGSLLRCQCKPLNPYQSYPYWLYLERFRRHSRHLSTGIGLGDSVKRSLSYQSFQFWNVKRFSSWKSAFPKNGFVNTRMFSFVFKHGNIRKGHLNMTQVGPKNFTSFNLGIPFFPASLCHRCTTGMGTRLARWLRESSAGRRLVHHASLWIHRNDLLQFKETPFPKNWRCFPFRVCLGFLRTPPKSQGFYISQVVVWDFFHQL